MQEGCLFRGVKYTLYLFNVIFFIVGVASLAVGIYVLLDQSQLAALSRLDNNEVTGQLGLLSSGSILMIVAGCFLIILAFIGCCGAMKEIKCILALYSCIVGLMIILQLTAFILAIVFSRQLEESFEATLYKQLNEKYTNYYNASDPFTKCYDYAMVYFECCGIRNYTEFKDKSKVSKWIHFNSQSIPAHCCKMDKDLYFTERLPKLIDTSCPTTLRSSNINKSCYDSLEEWVRERAAMLIIVAIIVACVQLVSLVLACCLMRCLDRPKDHLYS